MKRYSDQYTSHEERMRRASREAWRALQYLVIWIIIFTGSLIAIGWAAANGPWIDYLCNKFWK